MLLGKPMFEVRMLLCDRFVVLEKMKMAIFYQLLARTSCFRYTR
jgi:hypothetical protein